MNTVAHTTRTTECLSQHVERMKHALWMFDLVWPEPLARRQQLGLRLLRLRLWARRLRCAGPGAARLCPSRACACLRKLAITFVSFLVCNPVTSMYASLGVKPELICEQDKQLLERGHLPPIVSCVDRWPWSACCASTLPWEGLQLGRVAHQIAGCLVVLVHLRSHRSN